MITIGIHSGHGSGRSEDFAFLGSRVFGEGIVALPEEQAEKLGLCDGVGGNAGGQLAAEFVCTRMTEMDFTQMEEPELEAFLRQLNRELLDLAGMTAMPTMATTMSCILRGRQGYYLVHGGNTRIWALQGAYLKQLTADHTHRARLFRAGQREAAEQCPGNKIYCALGGGREELAGSFEVRKLEYEVLPAALLMTSDGIHDHLSTDLLEELLALPGSDGDRLERIIRAARKAGSRDDCTLILARQL